MNELIELLKASPGCRVTIVSKPARKKAANPRPKPKVGDRRLRGWNWFRYDFQMSRGCYIVGPRGGYRYEWLWERDATADEVREARAARKAAKLARQ